MSSRAVAVVTGAAQGIGLAVARRLAQDGLVVLMGDVQTGQLGKEASRLRESGLKAVATYLDVAAEASVEDAAEEAVRMGSLRAWVNDAALMARAPLLEISLNEWERIFAVNSRGCFLGTRAAGKRMAPGAAIVNFASISSFAALPNTDHYGASKGAVSSFTRHAALELGPLGIRVNAVAPGTTLTPMTSGRLADAEQRNRTVARTPLGRLGGPEDVADVVAFLCSDASAFISGTLVSVDGGWSVT